MLLVSWASDWFAEAGRAGHVVFYDLSRVQSNTIAEHWNFIESIPPQSEWKNTNNKFGF